MVVGLLGVVVVRNRWGGSFFARNAAAALQRVCGARRRSASGEVFSSSWAVWLFVCLYFFLFARSAFLGLVFVVVCKHRRV